MRTRIHDNYEVQYCTNHILIYGADTTTPRPQDAGKYRSRMEEKGYEWAAVLDLLKYFDTLNNDSLVREPRKTIKDEGVMKLIKKFPRVGVVIGTRRELSPLLANIYINEFDMEYAGRGVPKIRHGDDMV